MSKREIFLNALIILFIAIAVIGAFAERMGVFYFSWGAVFVACIWLVSGDNGVNIFGNFKFKS